MSLNQEQSVFLTHVAQLILKSKELGIYLTGGELYRTQDQQQIYLRDGRSKTLNSQHLKRLAIDFNFFKIIDGRWSLVYDCDEVRKLGAFWEGLDPANRWGGNWSSFKDFPHFERRSGFLISESNFVQNPPPAPQAPAQPEVTLPNGHETLVTAPTGSPNTSTSGRGKDLLNKPVGHHLDNTHGDVLTVQKLLNLNSGDLQVSKLKQDGIFGPNTANAIVAFKKLTPSTQPPSAEIKPGDATLLALCTKLPFDLTKDILGIVYTNAKEENIQKFHPLLMQVMQKYGISTPLAQSHFLAQIGQESGQLLYVEEIADGSKYEGRTDLGNTQPGDGKKYKGRGLIQLTGRENYQKYNAYIKSNPVFQTINLIEQPELLAQNDFLAADVAGWFWNTHGLNKLAEADDLLGITKKINGGDNGFVMRQALLRRFKTLLLTA